MQVESITRRFNGKTINVEYHQYNDGIIINDNTITSLRISACGVRLLGAYQFAYLRKLWLDGDILMNWVKYLPSLEDLTITGCTLTSYECNLPQLKRLRISNTYMVHVDVSCMKRAVSIDLSSNFIRYISFGVLPHLRSLNIAENNLQIIDLSGLLKLKTLNIGNNIIKILDIRNNTRLVNINTSYNKDLITLVNE